METDSTLVQMSVLSDRRHPSPNNVVTKPDLVLLNAGVGKDVYASGRSEVLRDLLDAALCSVIIAGVSTVALSEGASSFSGCLSCSGSTADGDMDVRTRVGAALPDIVHLLGCSGGLLG
jgi:hypothetical protein